MFRYYACNKKMTNMVLRCLRTPFQPCRRTHLAGQLTMFLLDPKNGTKYEYMGSSISSICSTRSFKMVFLLVGKLFYLSVTSFRVATLPRQMGTLMDLVSVQQKYFPQFTIYHLAQKVPLQQQDLKPEKKKVTTKAQRCWAGNLLCWPTVSGRVIKRLSL